MRREREQATLFELPPRELAPAPIRDEDAALGERLRGRVWLGTMSWSFPGWRGRVFAEDADAKRLSRDGLTAYSRQPLFGAVEIDRSYYEPLPASAFADWSAQVPAGFRFLVKAHEACVVKRFPQHARYGRRRGEPNPTHLNASYAAEQVVAPIVEGLGEKLGAIVFQFPPRPLEEPPQQFAAELGAFLSALPPNVPYAVELRTPGLLVPEYGQALAAARALHCHNVWGDMPSVRVQAKWLPPSVRRPLIVRWVMRRGDDYEGARSRYAPFDRLVEEDVSNREEIARLVARAVEHEVPAFVVVNNKAEGCAPESVLRLARNVAGRLAGA